MWDLFCGTGSIGLSLAQRAKQVVGFEVVPQAVADAHATAEANGVTNATFFCAVRATASRARAPCVARATCMLLTTSAAPGAQNLEKPLWEQVDMRKDVLPKPDVVRAYAAMCARTCAHCRPRAGDRGPASRRPAQGADLPPALRVSR